MREFERELNACIDYKPSLFFRQGAYQRLLFLNRFKSFNLVSLDLDKFLGGARGVKPLGLMNEKRDYSK